MSEVAGQFYVGGGGGVIAQNQTQLTSDNGLVQAYLKFVGIDFETVASNNHASPTGALPFLLPAHPLNTRVPIPSGKVQKWAIEQVHCEEEQQLNARFDVYASLLDHRIRTAWVCVPYWGPPCFTLFTQANPRTH